MVSAPTADQVNENTGNLTALVIYRNVCLYDALHAYCCSELAIGYQVLWYDTSGTLQWDHSKRSYLTTAVASNSQKADTARLRQDHMHRRLPPGLCSMLPQHFVLSPRETCHVGEASQNLNFPLAPSFGPLKQTMLHCHIQLPSVQHVDKAVQNTSQVCIRCLTPLAGGSFGQSIFPLPPQLGFALGVKEGYGRLPSASQPFTISLHLLSSSCSAAFAASTAMQQHAATMR